MFKKRTKRSVLLMLIMAMVLVFTACSNDEVPEESSDEVQEEPADEVQESSADADVDEEPEWKVAIETPEGETVELTDLNIEEVGKVDIQATIRKKDGTEEKNQWSGVPLKKVLEFVDISEYTVVEVEAADGFSVEYTPEIVESDGTILAVEVDGEKLDEDSGPVQGVVDGEGAKLWVKQVAKIKVSN